MKCDKESEKGKEEVPNIKKIIRTVPLRILRPQYSKAIEDALRIFKEKNDDANTHEFWEAVRNKDINFFEKELNLSNEKLDKIKEDCLFSMGIDNKVLFSYLDFLQVKLMQEYNKIISNIFVNRTKNNNFDKDLEDKEIDKFIEEYIIPSFGSYLGKGVKSTIKSNLGGNFVRPINGEKINKMTAINRGLMALPVAKSDDFPITIEKTGQDYIEFLSSNEKQLQYIDEYETGKEYGDLISEITIPFFKKDDNDKFILIKTEEAIKTYNLKNVRKNGLLNINLILTTYHIRRKKRWLIDGSSQSIIREIANKELETKWKSFFDKFIEKYGKNGKRKLLRTYRINTKDRNKETFGKELSAEKRLERLYSSIKAKSFPSRIDLIPEKGRWKLHLIIDIPPVIRDIHMNLTGGIDFGEHNIAVLCVRQENKEKLEYDYYTIWGNDILKHSQSWYARNRMIRSKDEYKARGHGISRKMIALNKFNERTAKLKQKITERIIKEISDFFLGNNKFNGAVSKLWYEDLNTLYKGETAKAKRMRVFINKQQLFNGIERKLKEYNPDIFVSSRFPHYTSRLCSKCGKLNLYFDFLNYRVKNIIIKESPNNQTMEYMPFFICEFCGWKQSDGKNASANISDPNYQKSLNEEKKVCNLDKKKENNEESEEKNEINDTKKIKIKKFNKTSLIYIKLKENPNMTEDSLYNIWKESLKRKPNPKSQFEQKEYKDRFAYLINYYKDIINDELQNQNAKIKECNLF